MADLQLATHQDLLDSILGVEQAQSETLSIIGAQGFPGLGVVDSVGIICRYTITPLIEGLKSEFRMDMQAKSTKYGFYALEFGGNKKTRTQAIPVNQPVSFSPFLGSKFTVVFYDLQEIGKDDSIKLSGKSWDETIGQDGFEVTQDSPISLELEPVEVLKLNDVSYGVLKRIAV